MEDSVITPALTAEEWADLDGGAIGNLASQDFYNASSELRVGDIAILNASLPDDSPYKITREDVTTLRLVVGVIMRNKETAQRMSDLADKLAALLPPETP